MSVLLLDIPCLCGEIQAAAGGEGGNIQSAGFIIAIGSIKGDIALSVIAGNCQFSAGNGDFADSLRSAAAGTAVVRRRKQKHLCAADRTPLRSKIN